MANIDCDKVPEDGKMITLHLMGIKKPLKCAYCAVIDKKKLAKINEKKHDIFSSDVLNNSCFLRDIVSGVLSFTDDIKNEISRLQKVNELVEKFDRLLLGYVKPFDSGSLSICELWDVHLGLNVSLLQCYYAQCNAWSSLVRCGLELVEVLAALNDSFFSSKAHVVTCNNLDISAKIYLPKTLHELQCCAHKLGILLIHMKNLKSATEEKLNESKEIKKIDNLLSSKEYLEYYQQEC
ncbi:hypothetical protein C0J52_08498 [Blattella germanica]|nr:hypothetical protein C0J52_08498 [Blattella germanica]